MLHIAEFQTGTEVRYWNGETFFKGKIHDLRLNPLSDSVEYVVKFKPSSTSKGFSRVVAQPRNIRESKHFMRGN